MVELQHFFKDLGVPCEVVHEDPRAVVLRFPQDKVALVQSYLMPFLQGDNQFSHFNGETGLWESYYLHWHGDRLLLLKGS